jgi:AI-2 transport protein TqsA
MSSQSQNTASSLAKTTYLLVSIICIVMILVYSEEYIIPFIIALIVWFVIHELRENLQQIPFIRKKFPIWLQSLIAFVIINAVLLGVFELLLISVSQLTESVGLYESNFLIAMEQLNKLVGMDVLSKVHAYTNDMDLGSLFSSTFDTVTLLVGDAFIILLYVIFILIEETIFHIKLKLIYPSDKEQDRITKLFEKMDYNLNKYLSLKTLVSLITGVLSYVVLLLLDIDAPFFWALLIFGLNYIPTIGSLIATVFPAVFAIVQFGALAPFVYVLLSVGAIQVIVGNIIEPKIMGKTMNISSLVVILSLTIWGAIWGVMGMILSVPITVMMIIICEEIPSLRFIAIMLSEEGTLAAQDIEEEKQIENQEATP